MRFIEVANILAFLKARGWTLDKTTETHYLMKPPKEMKTSSKTRFYLVRETFKATPDYWENMRQITKSIAQLYDLDTYLLEDLFSMSPQEIRQYNEVSHELLANAAA